MKCYNCDRRVPDFIIDKGNKKYIGKEGLLNPLRMFLKDDSPAGDRARKLVKRYNPNVRLCGICFWGKKNG